MGLIVPLEQFPLFAVGATVMDRAGIIALQNALDELRPADADYLIVAVGTRGPNIDCPEGNAVATIRMGIDEATAEAVYLPDAIALARGKILRLRAGPKRGGRPKRNPSGPVAHTEPGESSA